MEDTREALDNGEEIDVIYLDFCKAFDKVPHLHLLKKFSYMFSRQSIWVGKRVSDKQGPEGGCKWF